MAVTHFDVQSRAPFADSQDFGDAGPFEIIDGRVHFAVDPARPPNQRIIDLDRAPRDDDGKVRFSATFMMVTPQDQGRGNGRLLVDVPNRGNPLVAPGFHRVPAILPADRRKPGDGFLYHRGFTTISIGWQWDAEGEDAQRLNAPVATIDEPGDIVVKLQPPENRDTLALIQLGQTAPPYPIDDPGGDTHRLYCKPHEGAARQLIDRGTWSFTRSGEPSSRHISLDGGFRAGLIYELVYRSRHAPVVGAGLLAIRDVTSALRHGEGGSPLQHGFDITHGFGVSQTGRVLRQFLFDGLNGDEAGRRVFDGVFLYIAGAQRGDFNHRFAQPTVATVPSLGQRFPFALESSTDEHHGHDAGVLDHVPDQLRPKIMIANTSFEYWRGDASLAHITGEQDLPGHPDARIYHIAGTHHIGGILIQGRQITEVAATGLKVALPLNVVNAAPVNRALIERLDSWVSRNEQPPPSRHPRIDDGTAASRESVLEKFRAAGYSAVLADDKLGGIRTMEIAAEEKTMVRQPVAEGAMYTPWVSDVDGDLNEIAGIRLPDVAAPVGAHTGWNCRAADTGAGDQAAIFAGFSCFFDAADITSRYGSQAGYLERVDAVIDGLVADGFVLETDRDWLRQLAAERYDAAMAAGS